MTPFPVQIQSYPNVELSSYFSEPALFPHSYCLHLTNLLKTPWIFTLYFYFIYVSLGRRIMSYSSCSPQTLSLSTVGFYWLFLHLYNCLINDLVIFSIFIFFYQIYIKCHDLAIPYFQWKIHIIFQSSLNLSFCTYLFCPQRLLITSTPVNCPEVLHLICPLWCLDLNIILYFTLHLSLSTHKPARIPRHTQIQNVELFYCLALVLTFSLFYVYSIF